MQITFSVENTALKTTLVVPVCEDLKLSKLAIDIDNDTNGSIKKAFDMETFNGKEGQSLLIAAPANSKIMAILLVGVGKLHEFNLNRALKLGGQILTDLNRYKVKRAQVLADIAPKSDANIVAYTGFGMLLASYQFTKYKTGKDNKNHQITSIELLCKSFKDADSKFKEYQAVYSGVELTRNMVSEPPNVLYPETMAETCVKELEPLGVKVQVLGQKELAKLGLNTLLGVAQGSHREPKMVVMQYNGDPKAKDKRPVAFIGKGVTFDTGGISIKPAGGMEDMKYDMAGAGAVIGAMKALAGRKAKANVVGLVGLVENMPGGGAQRPADVVRSYSGQTVEVLNTDAEGRLVLCDVLWYAQEKFNPQLMIDLATLTGAIVISLANVYAGLFSNDDDLSTKLLAAGTKTDERLWRMPIGKEYEDMLKSDIADIANITNERGGGSCTAAAFLNKFTNNVPWAHLDIAATAWNKKPAPVSPKGATGFGVRLLDQFIRDNFEA